MGDRWRLSRRELVAWVLLVMVVSVLIFALRPWSARSEAVRVVRSDTAQTVTTSPVRLDLNHASEEELCVLPGVGAQRARQIVLFRSRQGAFRSVEQLAEVPGFTKALSDRLAPMLMVRQPADLPGL